MKNFISLLIITFSLLIISNAESYASCETGFTSKTVTMTVGNCDYYVEVCYKCETTNPGQVKLNRFWLVDSTCTNTLDIDIIVGTIYQEIRDAAYIYSNFCPDGLYNTPPCNEQGTSYNQFVIKYSYCWQLWIRWNGFTHIREYWPCEDNAECEETIKVCYNVITEEFETTRLSLTSPKTPPCDLQWFEITWPSPGNKSECFILNSVPCGIE